MLGSSYGTTGPGSRNPATGRPYGPDFPNITTGDMVAAQRVLLASLGIERLAAVIGYSFGGYLAFRSEEHTSELQSLMRISYAVFCLKKKKTKNSPPITHIQTITNINR